jgi:ribosomal protein S20
MPVTQSAKKAHRQSLTKRSRNRHFSALYREVLKKYQKAITAKSNDAATLLQEVYSAIDTLVKKNVLHKNNGARKKSQAAKMLARSGASDVAATPAKKAPAKKAAAPKAEKAEAPAKKPAAKKAPAKKAASSKKAA